MVTQLEKRLQHGQIVILDGAMGSELQRRGVPMHSVIWSGGALLTHPDLVRQVHEEYIRAGADVIITNTFSTARFVMEAAGLGDRVRETNIRAVQLAQEAREAAAEGRPVAIAGSISSFRPRADRRSSLSPDAARASYEEQAQLLAETGVDFLILEMLQDMTQSRYIIEAAVATGLPVWAGFSCTMGEDGATVVLRRGEPGETFAQALETFTPLGVSAVCVMHSEVRHVTPALAVARQHWQGPIGAYPHSGGWKMPEWRFEEIASPDELLEEARQWVGMGVRAVGACCGMGPEHIRLLSRELSSRTAAEA